MNFRLAVAGIGLLLASSGLFAASGAPQGVPVLLVVAAVAGAAAAVARFGAGRDATR